MCILISVEDLPVLRGAVLNTAVHRRTVRRAPSHRLPSPTPSPLLTLSTSNTPTMPSRLYPNPQSRKKTQMNIQLQQYTQIINQSSSQYPGRQPSMIRTRNHPPKQTYWHIYNEPSSLHSVISASDKVGLERRLVISKQRSETKKLSSAKSVQLLLEVKSVYQSLNC